MHTPRETAKRWKDGLAEWDQDGARIARLRAAADVTVYTPGSRTARRWPCWVARAVAAEAGEDAQADVATRPRACSVWSGSRTGAAQP